MNVGLVPVTSTLLSFPITNIVNIAASAAIIMFVSVFIFGVVCIVVIWYGNSAKSIHFFLATGEYNSHTTLSL